MTNPNIASPAPTPMYDRGGVQLYHGDSAEVLPALGVQADLIVTSPPYDAIRDYGGHVYDFERVAPAIAQALTTGGGVVLAYKRYGGGRQLFQHQPQERRTLLRRTGAADAR